MADLMTEPLMCLTVQQPWAWAIAERFKPVENRTWRTSHRGLLAIHSAKTADNLAVLPVREADRRYRALKARALLAGAFPPEAVRLKLSHVVAVVRLAGIHHASECIAAEGPSPRRLCSPWSFHGEQHWCFPDIYPLDPVPCHPGQLNVWPLPDDVAEAVRAQLGEAARG